MIILFFLILIVIIYILIKLFLWLVVRKFGKFSYDGFSATGFAYDAEKDIFYSTKNAWQKNFGYTHVYDVLAPLFRIIIDTEPIRFHYDNKNWLITFWKGQYGIVTGAEIGIYYTSQKKVNKRTIYLPVSDDEMLNISFTLFKNKKIITRVNDRHWWLAVFKLGMFSWPEDLSMDINITFPNHQMLKAFLDSFKKQGYTSEEFLVVDRTFSFKYIKPHTHKVWTRTWITDSIRQYLNLKNVNLYNKYFECLIDNDRVDDSKTDNGKKLIMINKLLPNILKNVPDNKKQFKQIIKKIFNEKEKQVVLSDNNVHSEIMENNNG